MGEEVFFYREKAALKISFQDFFCADFTTYIRTLNNPLKKGCKMRGCTII
jgi:hypothetical protein